jgi:hypothetical protein
MHSNPLSHKKWKLLCKVGCYMSSNIFPRVSLQFKRCESMTANSGIVLCEMQIDNHYVSYVRWPIGWVNVSWKHWCTSSLRIRNRIWSYQITRRGIGQSGFCKCKHTYRKALLSFFNWLRQESFGISTFLSFIATVFDSLIYILQLKFYMRATVDPQIVQFELKAFAWMRSVRVSTLVPT